MHSVLGCGQMLVDYTHAKFCDIVLTFGACRSQAGATAWEYMLLYPGPTDSIAVNNKRC